MTLSACDDLESTRCESAFDSTPPRVHEPQPLAGWSASPSQARKRATLSFVSRPEDCVAALLPKMKKIRLRPALGQLRLQREAHDANDFGPNVQVSIDPDNLRAVVVVALTSVGGGGGVSSGTSRGIARQNSSNLNNESFQVELAFPPQYPHRAPTVSQVVPSQCLPCLQYDAAHIVLPRLSERCWSSAMGVIDIVQDLLVALGYPVRPILSPCGLGALLPPATQTCSQVPQRDLFGSSVLLEDVEMS